MGAAAACVPPTSSLGPAATRVLARQVGSTSMFSHFHRVILGTTQSE